jgi:hypothetical protein
MLKKEYKKQAFANHPDRGGDTETMKEINAEYEKALEILKVAGCKQDKQNTEVAGDFINIINNIIHLEGLIIEIVGNWLWITGETKQHKDILKENGFYYASKKKAWYLKPIDYTGRSRKHYSLEQIKSKYGSSLVTGAGAKDNKGKSKTDFKPQLT